MGRTLVAVLFVLTNFLGGRIVETGLSNWYGMTVLHSLANGASMPSTDVRIASNRQGTRMASVQMLAEARFADARLQLESIPIKERSPLDWMRLAIATAYMGNLNRALVYVDFASIPTDALVRWGRRSWNVLGGKDQPIRAQLWFTAASTRRDGSWEARRDLGTWWLHHDPARALGYLEAVHTEHPQDAFSTYLLALAFAANGAPDRAVELMEGVYSQTPNPKYCSELARLYLERKKTGDRDHAAVLLKDCVARYPDALYLNEQLQNASR